jgi:hypothetical protein
MTPLLWVAGALFLGMALVTVVKPPFVLALFSVKVESADGRNEVRSVYGGTGFAVAAGLAMMSMRPELRPGMLTAMALLAAAMCATRVVSALADRSGGVVWLVAAVEGALAAIFWTAL